MKEYINKSGSEVFAASNIWTQPSATMIDGTANNLDTNLIDLNGDGLADFYYI
jgi:hypothetical protein